VTAGGDLVLKNVQIGGNANLLIDVVLNCELGGNHMADVSRKGALRARRTPTGCSKPPRAPRCAATPMPHARCLLRILALTVSCRHRGGIQSELPGSSMSSPTAGPCAGSHDSATTTQAMRPASFAAATSAPAQRTQVITLDTPVGL
jgi:hypothetical protein